MQPPLRGVTVVSLEHAVAAPHATRQLADLGARVIKVERPDGGDFARGYDDYAAGLAAYFLWLNRGKESVALDAKEPGGRAALHRLVERADVLVSNLGPGALRRLGLDPVALRASNPRLVVCEITGYGNDGPFAAKKAYDLLVQAEAGLVGITGSPDAAAKPGAPVADLGTGSYAVQAILAALFRRERSGEGATIEVAMFDMVVDWLGLGIVWSRASGEPLPRAGTGHPTLVPYDAYPTADGPVLIGVQNDREWVRLATDVLGRPELAGDERYATVAARLEARHEVDRIVSEALSALSFDEAVSRLDAAGIANARLTSTVDLLSHPNLDDRDRWVTVDTPVGPQKVLRPAATFAGWAPELGPVPSLGQHTASVLREIGIDEAELCSGPPP